MSYTPTYFLPLPYDTDQHYSNLLRSWPRPFPTHRATHHTIGSTSFYFVIPVLSVPSIPLYCTI